tara:strand:- start:2023 stop:2202 length:180 start_codon:yes stop_codon:yes gene_type:complete
MEQFTCLQPKGPVIVSFLKNIKAFFIDSEIFQNFPKDLLSKIQFFNGTRKACQGKLSER